MTHPALRPDDQTWRTLRRRLGELGLTPDDNKRLNWAAGDALQREYVRTYGAPPPKSNRPKASGRGSHCFASYPPEFLPVMDRILRAMWASYSSFSQQSYIDWPDDQP